jgi:hypothetical protein
MIAGPSGRCEVAGEIAPCAGLSVMEAVAAMPAEAETVGAFEGDGDAAIIIAPRIIVSATAIAFLNTVAKADRDSRRAAVDSGESMIRQRTLSLADRLFRYAVSRDACILLFVLSEAFRRTRRILPHRSAQLRRSIYGRNKADASHHRNDTRFVSQGAPASPARHLKHASRHVIEQPFFNVIPSEAAESRDLREAIRLRGYRRLLFAAPCPT